MARLLDGSGAAQFALKLRGELLSPQARHTYLRAPLLTWKSTPYQLCGTTKEYRRYFHLYSRIIPYLFRFVNKIQTNVRILLFQFQKSLFKGVVGEGFFADGESNADIFARLSMFAIFLLHIDTYFFIVCLMLSFVVYKAIIDFSP